MFEGEDAIAVFDGTTGGTLLHDGNPLEEKHITTIKSKPSNAPHLLMFDSLESGAVEDKVYELAFVRFAYRWKFKDGQVSVMSPFSEAAFMPGNFEYDIKNSYNVGMQNQLSTLKISGFEFGDDQIESVDILLKRSNDNTIYRLERVALSKLQALNEITVTNEQVYSVLSSDQLLRQWDAVPLKAKSQEVVGGRLVYGNYTIGEDTKDIIPEFGVTVENRTSSSYRRSLKSNRTYQLGVLFEDKYGRQTPVLSNTSGSINIPFNDKDHLSNFKALNVAMADTLPAQHNFTKFKFFVKDPSSEYYNIAVESVFPDPGQVTDTSSGNDVWAAVPSNEINKFKEGDIIFLKKRINDQVSFASWADSNGFNAKKAKFRVAHVQSDAPDFVSVVPSNLTEVEAVTNFPYGTFETEGKFFIKLVDTDDILKQMYTVNPNPTVGYEIVGSVNLSPWATIGVNWAFLGNRTVCEQDQYTSQWKKRTFEYYFDPNSQDGILYVKDAGTVVDQYCTSYTGTQNPESTLVTSDVITDCGETITGNDRWYGPFTTPAIDATPSRTLYAQWNVSQNGGVDKVYICPSEAILNLDTPAIFETESETNILDLYYETEKSYPIAEYNDSHELSWFNCYNFQNGVESNRIRDDYNNVVLDKQVRVSTVLEDGFNQVENKTGLIWSGLFNSRNGVNNLNQFSTAEPITKDLNPEYGSIQLLHTRDTDLIAFCEDKILRILANKDALYNANGSTNITASNAVLGQAVPYNGEFGISKNPESFASYGYQAYFTDESRGAVLRLSRDGLTLISSKGMTSYFRDAMIDLNGPIIGSYDIHAKQYILSLTGVDKTLGFSEASDGWTSFFTFTPDFGAYLDGKYYTFKKEKICGSVVWSKGSNPLFHIPFNELSQDLPQELSRR